MEFVILEFMILGHRFGLLCLSGEGESVSDRYMEWFGAPASLSLGAWALFKLFRVLVAGLWVKGPSC